MRYTVSHGSYNGRVAQGICGIVPNYWEQYLNSKDIPINSLQACEAVYLYYLKKYKGNKYKALKKYKGIKSTKYLWVLQKILTIEQKLNKKYKDKL